MNWNITRFVFEKLVFFIFLNENINEKGKKSMEIENKQKTKKWREADENEKLNHNISIKYKS